MKESYAPVVLGYGQGASFQRPGEASAHHAQALTHEGQRLGPGAFQGLYLMLRSREGGPGTDDGWVYATVDRDARTVLRAGRLAECMSCHQRAPQGRLFGLRASP